MRRVCLPILIGAALCSASPGAVGAAVRRPALAHHLSLGKHTPVFTYALTGGTSRGGSFHVIFYGDGRVALKKDVRTSPLRLTNPLIQIRGDALDGLLKLAEAEKFFQMPARKIGPNPLTDASTSCITIVTVEETKRACIFSAHVPAFNQLWAILEYVSGLQI
ncbi:MAG TPA: hypothetical protein VF898_14575 [Chloroflexota bacterium]